MASKRTVAKALAVAGTVWPRDITPELTGIYAAALADIPDAKLESAIRQAVKRCKFFPTPAELREFAGPDRDRQQINVDALIDQIERLSSYDPINGTRLPSVAMVRWKLGTDVADAYALAGGSLLFSRSEYGRVDAMRIFRRELLEARKATIPQFSQPALTAGQPIDQPLLPAQSGPEDGD